MLTAATPDGRPLALIVDDDATTRALLAGLLRPIAHSAVAVDTVAATEFLAAAAADATLPDIVLMDVTLPGEDGIAATARLKADPRFADLPIVVVTADSGDATLEAAFAAGATDYLCKPVRPADLRARVRSAVLLGRELGARRRSEAALRQVTRGLEEANLRLRDISERDPLTGLANRRRFGDAFATEWRRAHRDGRPLSIAVIDVDHFKLYNDRLGHQAGDTCLAAVAAAARDSVHRAGDLAARWGGEEFVLLLPETSEDGAAAVAEHLRALLAARALAHPAAAGACVTVSVGVACAEGIALMGDTAGLFAAADRAMYEAKATGRDRVVRASTLPPFP